MVERLELGDINQLICEVAAQAARNFVFGVAQTWALKATEICWREHSKKVACILFASHFNVCFVICTSAQWQTMRTCWNANRRNKTSKHRNASQVMWRHHLKKIYAKELHQVFLVLLYLQCFLLNIVFKFHTVNSLEISWNHIQPILGSFCKRSYEIS